MNRKIITGILTIFVLLFTACASTGSRTGLSLMEAIEQTAEKIAGELPKGSRVAIVAFESSNANLSDYIMEELTGALFDRGIEVADRQNLEYVYKELNLQMSGDVSDESAKYIGKFLGASMVITGQLLDISGAYRYRASVISVEEAVRASVTRLNVKKDDEMRRLVTSLANQKVDRKKSKYGISENTMPKTAGEFLDRGIIFADRSDFEMAIADFNEALKLNPNLSAAYVLRGRALVADVVGTNRLKLKDNFSGIETFSLKGNVDDKEKITLEKALADYTQALRLDPNNAVIYKERGDVYSHLGEPDKAISDFNQALRFNPNYSTAYSGRSNAYADKSEENRAIADINQAIKLDPNDAFLYRMRAYYYYHLYENNKGGDIDRIIADYTKAIQLDPNDAISYSVRGRLYAYKNDIDQAIADYTKAIQLDPNNAWFYYDMRGGCFEVKRQIDKAIEDYTKVIQLAPSYSAYYSRAKAYENKGDIDKAIADYTIIIEFDPKYAGSYSYRGLLYLEKKDYDEAITDFAKALSLASNNFERDNSFSALRYTYIARGDAYLDKKDYDKAIADYSQVIKLNPNDSYAYRYRGDVYLNKKDYDKALAEYSQAIRLNPNDAHAYNGRGIAYWWKNDLNRALTDIEAALRIEPNNAVFIKDLEEVKRQRGW